ncbi:hypothetical protein CPB83DRAFT_81013 [Crepidotus variabilis]|uniref:Uncharacterized protein n=1 Tax=Crepidotus variabilis TaxID=179855 RepID=A0A9P6EKX8_9AGAR|nr:hypothetical protein CPB83DRAFT_81013 [Crepidotus variabilis]
MEDPSALTDEVNPTLHITQMRVSTQVDSILVRYSYVEIMNRIWRYAFIKDRLNSGVIFTGQSGTGKRLFLWYLLVRLLHQKQPVLFSPDGVYLYLFLAALHIHHRLEIPTGICTSQSQNPSAMNYSSGLWSMSWEKKNRVSYLHSYIVFLCNLPLRIRFATSVGRREGTQSLWDCLCGHTRNFTKDWIVSGIRLNYENASTSCWPPGIRTEHPSGAKGLPGIPEILLERFPVDEAATPSVEEVLHILLDAAVEHFGFAARDTYHAMFHWTKAINQHINDIKANPNSWKISF